MKCDGSYVLVAKQYILFSTNDMAHNSNRIMLFYLEFRSLSTIYPTIKLLSHCPIPKNAYKKNWIM